MPNDHQGPPDALLVWPEQRHAPWQSSGPNELISQLEALDGGTWATWGRLEGQRETERERGAAGRGARYEHRGGVERLRRAHQLGKLGRCSFRGGLEAKIGGSAGRRKRYGKLRIENVGLC